MGMGIRIVVEEKYLWILLAVLVFIIGTSFVVAIGEHYLVHGHDQDEINLPACANGQILKRVGTVWSCQNDIGGGTLSCVYPTAYSGGNSQSVSCTSPRVVTGGGCQCATLVHESRRSGNGWYCRCSIGAGGVTAYAMCCSIS